MCLFMYSVSVRSNCVAVEARRSVCAVEFCAHATTMTDLVKLFNTIATYYFKYFNVTLNTSYYFLLIMRSQFNIILACSICTLVNSIMQSVWQR